MLQLAVEEMEVGAADAASPDRKQNLTRAGTRRRPIDLPKGGVRRPEEHRLHARFESGM